MLHSPTPEGARYGSHQKFSLTVLTVGACVGYSYRSCTVGHKAPKRPTFLHTQQSIYISAPQPQFAAHTKPCLPTLQLDSCPQLPGVGS